MYIWLAFVSVACAPNTHIRIPGISFQTFLYSMMIHFMLRLRSQMLAYRILECSAKRYETQPFT